MEGELYYKYTIAKDPLYIKLKFYENGGVCTDLPLNYSIEIRPKMEFDNVISYDGSKIKIYTNNRNSVGGYIVRITANTPNRVNNTAEIFVRIEE